MTDEIDWWRLSADDAAELNSQKANEKSDDGGKSFLRDRRWRLSGRFRKRHAMLTSRVGGEDLVDEGWSVGAARWRLLFVFVCSVGRSRSVVRSFIRWLAFVRSFVRSLRWRVKGTRRELEQKSENSRFLKFKSFYVP